MRSWMRMYNRKPRPKVTGFHVYGEFVTDDDDRVRVTADPNGQNGWLIVRDGCTEPYEIHVELTRADAITARNALDELIKALPAR